MAPVRDYNHVEIHNIGRGKRVLKPPGGECSDIFGTQVLAPEQKVKNSVPAGVSTTDGNVANGQVNGSARKKPPTDTQNRLFGPPTVETTPKKVVDRMKSSLFSEDDPAQNKIPTSTKKYVSRNPITGEVYGIEPKVNGHTNGVNGSS